MVPGGPVLSPSEKLYWAESMLPARSMKDAAEETLPVLVLREQSSASEM
jgi:hypothetical protein